MNYLQLQKATPGRRRKSKGLLHRLQARTYRLPAHVTSEDDGARDVPNIKLSRAFAIVLGIHVIAIGGFMAFELFRHKEPSNGTDGASPSGPVADAPGERVEAAKAMTASASRTVSSAAAPRALEPNLDDPANDGLQTYVVGPGETLSAIATQFNVDERLLAQKNGIGAERPFEAGMKLVIPNHQIVAQKPEDVKRLLADRERTATPPPIETRTNESVPSPSPAAKTAKSGRSESPPLVKKAEPPTAEADLPVRRAEPVRESSPVEPNKDPKRVAAPPATLAAAQASRLSSASASSPPKAAAKRPAVVPADAPGRAKTAAVKTKTRTHRVAEGETAYRIARTYKVNLDQLIKANGIKPESLRPGTELVIPIGGR